MEMGSYMKARGMRAIVEWAPREFNKEADQLVNGISDRRSPGISFRWRFRQDEMPSKHSEISRNGMDSRIGARNSESRY